MSLAGGGADIKVLASGALLSGRRRGNAEGTGDRPTVGMLKPPKPEVATDRVVNDEEAGLGGGLDQAEEAQLGITDEELEAMLKKKRKP